MAFGLTKVEGHRAFEDKIKSGLSEKYTIGAAALLRSTCKMVKISQNPLKIDFKKCIVENRLLQIRDTKNIDVPTLVNVWTVDINPKESKIWINFIKTHLQDRDPISYLHIKRLKKIVIDDIIYLRVIICSKTLLKEHDDVVTELARSDKPLRYTNLIGSHVIPLSNPSTKELVQNWSENYWPLIWRGNPNDQILNDYKFDMMQIRKMLDTLAKLSNESFDNGKRFPIVTIFVDPTNKDSPVISIDQRDDIDGFDTDHSIMLGIEKVAGQSCKDKQNSNMSGNAYLCLNYDVYSTHEPCSMCSMALIHSRIKRFIFLKPMPKTGTLRPESGKGLCMHSNKLLNSKYEVFQWIGDEYVLPQIDENAEC